MDQKSQNMDLNISKIFYTLFAICGIFFNALEIWLLLNKGKKMSCFEMILFSLGCDDIFAATTFLVLGISIIVVQDFALHLSYKMLENLLTIILLSAFITAFSVVSSLLHVGLLTLDRYIAVSFPLWHKIQITKRKLGSALVVVWLCTAVVTFVVGRLAGLKIFKITISGVIISVCILMMVSYFCIVRKFKSSERRKIQWNESTQKPKSKESIRTKQERVIIVNSLAVTLCFVVCFMPTVYITFKGPWPLTITSIPALNTVLDPSIYFLSSYYIKRIRIQRSFSTSIRKPFFRSTSL